MTAGKASLVSDPLKSAELDAALSNCLSCKGCTPECPSNVNLALLKAEMLHARWRRDGLPLRERILSNIDLLGKLGCTDAEADESAPGFQDGANGNGKNSWNLRTTIAAPLRK